MVTTRYLGVQLRTGRVMANLVPTSEPVWERQLKGSGTATVKLQLPGHPGDSQALLDATDPVRCALFVQHGDQLWWGGVIWKRDPSGPGELTISAAEPGSYFARVRIRNDLTLTGVDQLSIARSLVNSHQAQTGGNIRVLMDTTSSPRVRDRTYLAGDAKRVGAALQELADVSDGFDYAWQPAWHPLDKNPSWRLALGYPTLGSPTVRVLFLRMLRGWGWPEDGSSMATASLSTGAKVGGVLQVAEAVDSSLLALGYPLLDRVDAYSDVTDTDTLSAHAAANLQAAAGVVVQVPVDVPVSLVYDEGLGLGDVIELRFPSGVKVRRFPTGLSVRLRVVGIKVNGDTATLSLAPRTLLGGRVPRASDLATQLAQLSRQVGTLQASA